MKIKRVLFNLLVLLLSLSIVACSNESKSTTNNAENEKPDNTQKEEVQQGGEVRVALSSQPNTLDTHMDSNIYTRDVGRLIFETLVTPDEKYQPQPMLAESVDVSDDSKVYTFHLRKGVLFHNGKEMTAKDVVASMNRWMEKSPLAGSVFKDSTFEIKDDYTVVLTLAKPSALALDIMASPKQAAAIMPKEVIESATPKGVTEFIGTGPYKLVEWKQDQYIHFAKNKDYKPLDTNASGLAGKREVFLDDLYFDIVTDPSTRLSGLQTEQYDIAYHIGYTDYDQVKNSTNMKPFLDPHGELTFWYNSIEGIASNPKFREAVNAALDVDEIMKAAFSNEDFYSLYSSYMNEKIKNWSSEIGKEYYNQKDTKKAKQLLQEIGYKGEEFRIMTTRGADYVYNSTVVIQEQLKEVGINVKLEVFDTTTLLEKRNKPSEWDSYVLGSSIVSTPTQLVSLTQNVKDDKIKGLLTDIENATNLEEAKQKWDELQLYAWQYLPVTSLGGFTTFYATTDKINGFSTFLGPVFWNVSINK